MTDQEAREKTAQDTIADALREIEADYAPGNASKLASSRRILAALAADGWAVIRTEWEYGLGQRESPPENGYLASDDYETLFALSSARRSLWRRTCPGPWEPVPEGSDHAYEQCPDLATCEPHGARWIAEGSADV